MKRLLAMTASATFTISGYVPAIVEVKQIDNIHVSIRANVPVHIDGNLTNCTVPLTEMPLETICQVDGTLIVTAE